MCSSLRVEIHPASVEVVDLGRLAPPDLEPLWERETRLWHQVLHWDVSRALTMVRRAVERKNLSGKAARLEGSFVGYGYYLLEGHRAVLSNLVVAAEADGSRIGPEVLGSLLASLEADPKIQRIESHFVSFDMSWLAEVFAAHGFRGYGRCFLRRSLKEPPSAAANPSGFVIESWSPSLLWEAALLLQEAHAGRVDAEMNELYRTQEGCRSLLDGILVQKGCGEPLPFSCLAVRDHNGTLGGLVVTTEISAGHAHVAQVAVGPAFEGQGLGKFLITAAVHSLAQEGYRSVSLMVSGANRRAFSLYLSLGFEKVLSFPVFSWDRGRREAPSR